MHDPVNTPAHYTQGGVETIDYLEGILRHTGHDPRAFLLGNVIKYIARHTHKGGDEDLKKALNYLYRAVHGVWLRDAEVAVVCGEDAELLCEHIMREQVEKVAAEKHGAPTISNLQEKAHKCAVEHGWWDGVDLTPDTVASKLCLIHSEVSEALEAVRKDYPDDEHCPEHGSLSVELADVVIRILDLCGGMGIDLESALVAKMEFNMSRPYRHGKVI